MMNAAALTTGRRTRMAFRFSPSTVAAHLPAGVVGTYLLYDDQRPLYIGRSDTCLRRRLMTHPLLGHATHVAWDIASCAERAFLSEAFWFHEIHDGDENLNRIHPARPAGSTIRCPFCIEESVALTRALTGDDLPTESFPTVQPTTPSQTVLSNQEVLK